MDPELLDPDRAYAVWAAEYPPMAHNAVMMAEERAMLSLLAEDLRENVVLDAACGTGRYLLNAMRRRANRLIGFDRSPEMLGRARRELRGEAVLLLADIESIPLDGGTADVTICGLA